MGIYVLCTTSLVYMLRFLILDPHYTGKDELKFVLGKVCIMNFSHFIMSAYNHHVDLIFPPKGCDWKNVNFWDSTVSF